MTITAIDAAPSCTFTVSVVRPLLSVNVDGVVSPSRKGTHPATTPRMLSSAT